MIDLLTISLVELRGDYEWTMFVILIGFVSIIADCFHGDKKL